MATKVQPMSAARGLDESTAYRLKYPLLKSIKLDGIRGLVLRNKATGKPTVYSKVFKPIRSAFIQRTFGREEFIGADGEFILGDPADPKVCNKTYSAVMTVNCETPVDYYLFDRFTYGNETFETRFNGLVEKVQEAGCEYVKHLEQKLVRSWDEILEAEQHALESGFEGLILRKPDGIYKFGRSTLIEQLLVKLKRMEDAEAQIIGFTELMLNQNAPVLDALGYQKRSSSKEGKVPGNTLGTLQLRDLKSGVEFEVGSGWDDSFALEVWNNREKYLSGYMTYKHFPIGRIDKPRQPIFKCLRDASDILELHNA